MAIRSFVAAIDQGTTSTRFIVYNEWMQPVASHQVQLEQIYPEVGWVEHDPLVILDTVKRCVKETERIASSKGLDLRGQIKTLGITNQRETIVVWSKKTGKPLYNAIVWMDVRTSNVCKEMEKKFALGRNQFAVQTGLPISTYCSAVKLVWLIENVPEVKAAIESNDALFGTIETWLVWNLTEAHVHISDCTNASRTMLMNLDSQEWDDSILEQLGIDKSILPAIVSNAETVGHVVPGYPLLSGTPISSCIGDQHAALLGHRCLPGQAKATYGTGCFVLYNTGPQRPIQSSHGLLGTISFQLGPNEPVFFALEGSIAMAGAAVQWLRDGLGIIEKVKDVEDLAMQVSDCGGVYFVPAFSGLFAPRWREDARGVIVGLTHYSNKAHMARAVLEAISFQCAEVIAAMHSDFQSAKGQSESSQDPEPQFLLRADGGASVNNLLMQIQADLLGCPVIRPADPESTALGAALAAGLAVGLWTQEEVFSRAVAHKGKSNGVGERSFLPALTAGERSLRMEAWNRAVEKSFGLA